MVYIHVGMLQLFILSQTDGIDVLLTVHLSIILAINQLNAQNLLL